MINTEKKGIPIVAGSVQLRPDLKDVLSSLTNVEEMAFLQTDISGSEAAFSGDLIEDFRPSDWSRGRGGNMRQLNLYGHQRWGYKVVASPANIVADLIREFQALRTELEILKKEQIEKKVIVIRQINNEEAKVEIKELLQLQGDLYFSDIAEKLKLDLKLVVQLCDELRKEGVISDGDAR